MVEIVENQENYLQELSISSGTQHTAEAPENVRVKYRISVCFGNASFSYVPSLPP
jgi:hypothetical protein